MSVIFNNLLINLRHPVECSCTTQARLLAYGCGDVSTPSFVSHLNTISTKGADYAHPILVSTLSFESHRRACSYILSFKEQD